MDTVYRWKKGRLNTDVMLFLNDQRDVQTRHRMRREAKGTDGNGAVVKGVSRGEDRTG